MTTVIVPPASICNALAAISESLRVTSSLVCGPLNNNNNWFIISCIWEILKFSFTYLTDIWYGKFEFVEWWKSFWRSFACFFFNFLCCLLLKPDTSSSSSTICSDAPTIPVYALNFKLNKIDLITFYLQSQNVWLTVCLDAVQNLLHDDLT